MGHGCRRGQGLVAALDRNEGGFIARMATKSCWRTNGRQWRRGWIASSLAPVYGWFTEGFETADLKDAKALLREWSTLGALSRVESGGGQAACDQLGEKERLLVSSLHLGQPRGIANLRLIRDRLSD
jgi:hypothetical protein